MYKEFSFSRALNFAMKCNYFWKDGNFFLQKTGVVMGAKFILSLFVYVLVGGGCHLGVSQPEFALWRRYMDDNLLLWRADEDSLHSFMAKLNANDLDIKLSYE